MLFPISFTLLVGCFLAYAAKAKGYNPFIWFFAGGLLGYAILAFLPNVSPILGRTNPTQEQRRKRGNLIGAILLVSTISLPILLIAYLDQSLTF